jgi:hypothetical protein
MPAGPSSAFRSPTAQRVSDEPLGLGLGSTIAVSDEEVKDDLRRAELDVTNDLRHARYSQETSAIRSLQVVNAGGAVALLAFLGQTWGVAPELRIALVIAISLMIVGLLLAVWRGFQLPGFSERRYRQSESGCASKKYDRMRSLYHGTIGLSFLAFVVAALCFSSGWSS